MEDNDNKIYKIRRKSDGLFSLGSEYPTFNKQGKAWTRKSYAVSAWRGHVRWATPRRLIITNSSIVSENMEDTEVVLRDINQYTGLCEIVEFNLVESSVWEPQIGKKNEKNGTTN